MCALKVIFICVDPEIAQHLSFPIFSAFVYCNVASRFIFAFCFSHNSRNQSLGSSVNVNHAVNLLLE